MADGIYTIRVAGIEHDNPTAANQTSPQTTLADGSKLNTEVREGSITIDDAPGGGESLHLVDRQQQRPAARQRPARRRPDDDARRPR